MLAEDLGESGLRGNGAVEMHRHPAGERKNRIGTECCNQVHREIGDIVDSCDGLGNLRHYYTC